MAGIGYNPLNVVPYKKEELQALIDKGLPVFQQQIKDWYRGFALALHPDRAPDDKKKNWGDWLKFYNPVYDPIMDADETTIRKWIETQHGSGGADDALLAVAANKIANLEARLTNALTALNRGRTLTPAELLRIVDPDYATRLSNLQQQNRNLQGRVDAAERDARTYRQQATDANNRANKAEGEVRTYRQQSERNEQRATTAEKSAKEQRDRATSLEERLNAETIRKQLAESRLETANQNLEHTQKYGQDVFSQLQLLQGQFAALQEEHTRTVATSLDVFVGMVKRYELMPADQIYQEARYFRLNGKFWEAIEGFKQVLARDPNNLHANAELGVAYKGLWERDKDANYRAWAVRYSKRALEIEPRHQFSRDIEVELIGQAYREAHELRLNGKYPEAIAIFEQILEWDTNHLHANADLGALYSDRFRQTRHLRDRDLAIQYSKRALEIEPRHQFSRDIVTSLEDITNLDYRQRIRVIGDPDSPQESFQQNVPLYAVSSGVLKEAFKYLFTDNPEIAEKGRLERLVYFFGSKDSNEVKKIQGLAYPKLAKQDTSHVSAEQTDSNRILIELDQKGLAWYSMAHNHNWVMFNEKGNSTGAVSPSPDDLETHEGLEQGYKPFLTVIFSPDGYVGFWQPREFEIFIDGKRLPATNTPNLRENTKVYKLN